jgi:hypothetical protein
MNGHLRCFPWYASGVSLIPAVDLGVYRLSCDIQLP